jgi:hypothetical protein
MPSPGSTRTGPLTVVPPPAKLQRISVRPGEGPGTWISYASHPAYETLVRSASLKARFGSLLGFSKYLGVILCKRLISYELIPGHLRKPRSASGVVRLLSKAARNALRNLVPRQPGTATSNEGHAVQRALGLDGVCVAQVGTPQLAQISAAAQPLYDELRKARGTRAEGGRDFDESRSYALRTAHAELFAAVESTLTLSGILDGVSAYIGRPASLIDVNPQINDKSDDFWRRIFADLPAAERPVAYLHRDATGGDIKAILYMCDVTAENGPFSYVIGSQKVNSGRVGDWIEQTNDQSSYSGTGRLNRGRFAALPAFLRRKCAFGNDVLPGTEVSQRLLGAEWTISAPRGSIVLFDTKGFHRGGMVNQGERLVLTCVLG